MGSLKYVTHPCMLGESGRTGLCCLRRSVQLPCHKELLPVHQPSGESLWQAWLCKAYPHLAPFVACASLLLAFPKALTCWSAPPGLVVQAAIHRHSWRILSTCALIICWKAYEYIWVLLATHEAVPPSTLQTCLHNQPIPKVIFLPCDRGKGCIEL